jgi:hypothetical protein
MQAALEEAPKLDETVWAVENGLPPLEESEEDMKLREDDKAEIYAEIRKIVSEVITAEIVPIVDRRFDELAKSPRFKLLPILRNSAYVTTIVVVFIALIGFAFVEHTNSTNRLGDEKLFEGTTTQNLQDLTKHVDQMQAQISGLTLNQIGDQPINTDTVAAVKHVIATAKSENATLDPTIVASIGTRFINTSESQPDAWNAAKVLLEYRSYLNENFHPDGDIFQVEPNSNFILHAPPPHYDGRLSLLGPKAPPDQVEIDVLGQPSPTFPGAQYGPSYARLAGGTLHLDNLRLKNVIVVGATIVYGGGPASLRNVYFVNCKFEIERQHSGQLLAEAILSGPSVTFSA